LKKIYTAIALILLLILVGCKGEKKDQVQINVIDGIRHIMNPQAPLKGTILLEVEKTLEINPYEHEEVGMRFFYSARDKDGEITLFDSNNAEAHRFNENGEYLGNLIRIGQGPGEFQKFHGLQIYFLNNMIWATSTIKIAKFDKEGNLIDEKKLLSRAFGYIMTLVDENRYIARKSEWTDQGQLREIILVNFSGEESRMEAKYFNATEEWLIEDRENRRAFNDLWATPSIKYDYNPYTQTIAVGLNKEYKITVKDLQGNTLYIIERPYQRVNLSLEEKKKITDWKPDSDFHKWKLSMYPDTLAAIKDIKTLPKGYLAVYRISGAGNFEIDVYDPEGKYVYIIKAPEDISLERPAFYEFGFGIQEERDEMPVYLEYRIKNLPEIFGN